MSNYVVMARKAGDHFFLGKASDRFIVGDWRSAAIFGPCRRIELDAGGNFSGLKFIGLEPSERAYVKQLVIALLNTGPVNLGLTNEVGDGQLRLMICFPDEQTLDARMAAAESDVATAIAEPAEAITDQLLSSISAAGASIDGEDAA